MPLTQTAERRIPAVEVLEPRARDSWTHTRNGDPRGYIDSDKLKELWIHTGTACNLACPFCLEGSHPGDGRIPGMKLSDVKPFIHEALDMGVEQFSFTGGEPFVIKDFINILDYASQHRPCFVLTNATDPLLKRRHQVLPLLDNAYPIHFRVSLDFPDRARHDMDRGEGSFDKALEGIRWLVDQGFQVSIARQTDPEEIPADVEAAFREILRDWAGQSDSRKHLR
jgi:MoaA/NifB/PqqE/SkfB family radical SAM enzyme